MLDGEVTCIQPDGRSDFYSLMFRPEWPVFYAFDLLSLGGEDLRSLPLLERKARLHEVMPKAETRLRYVDHLPERDRDVYRLACERDTEGIVAKLGAGSCRKDGQTTSWLKIKNPAYSQMEGRREPFERRREETRAGTPASYRLDSAIGPGPGDVGSGATLLRSARCLRRG